MSISKFLPEQFDPTKTIAVLAGRGDYPDVMVNRIRANGLNVRLIALEGETPDTLFEQFEPNHRTKIKVGQVGKMLKWLKSFDCSYSIMVGQVRPGRLFNGLHPDIKALQILKRLKERNAETIYSAVVDEMSHIGVETLDARSFIDDQMASPGLMTSGKNRIPDWILEHGIRIANEIARLDIGQGVVVKEGTVLCVEEFNGTDEMLRRAASYNTGEKLFVKTVKPNQNYAIDVPVFGETTLKSMKVGGISNAALAVDKTIILHKQEVIDHANREKIQIAGFEIE